MTTPTLREALEWNAEVLIAQSGRTSESSTFALNGQKKTLAEVMEMARAALAAQPELPEPLCAFRRKNQINQEWETCSKKQWAIFSQKPAHYELALFYTADQIQQAVEQAQAKRGQMGDTDLARLFREIYGGTRFGESERLLARTIEAHHGIGGKA